MRLRIAVGIGVLLKNKSEIRISKSETNSKSEFSNKKNEDSTAFRFGFWISCFGFVSDFGFRISCFGFPRVRRVQTLGRSGVRRQESVIRSQAEVDWLPPACGVVPEV